MATRASDRGGDLALGGSRPELGGHEEDWSEQRGIPRRLKILAYRLLFMAIVFPFWEWASGTLIRPFFVSSPSAIAIRLWDWVMSGYIFLHMWVTFQEMIGGFVVGSISGMVVGFVFGRNQTIADTFSPFITALYSLPKLALAPLFILWFGIGFESKVVFVATVVFFLVFYNTYAGVREVSPLLVNMVTLMGASGRQVLTKVILPSASTWIFAGLKISVPYALVGAVVAELISSNRGLGSILAQTASMFDTTGLFAGLVMLMVIALAMNELVDRLEKRALRWKREA